jgi:ABC transporter DrrB family efflux protein
MRRLVSDTLVIAERNLVRLPRAPDLLIAFTVQPVMFVLLFVYVFGGAISTPGYSYVDFLIPGIIVQNIAFGGFVTALGLNEDLHKGLIDRFRSLPMARAAVLAGRTLADVVTNFLSVIVLIVTGLIIGFSFDASALEIVGGIALLLLFGYAFSWVFALLGLLVSSPESANSVGFLAVFPLTFISSAFVPVDSMPSALQWFAEINPFTIMVDAMRALWVGAPAGNNVWAPSSGRSSSSRSSHRWRWRAIAGPQGGDPPGPALLGRAARDFLAQRLDPRQRGAVGLVEAVEARGALAADEVAVEVADQPVQQRAVRRAAVEQRVPDVTR